ncbi:arginine N-succinyltransferase [Marinobacter fonticola]|uniref:arginine N-succinyltransferase n=1 Tax=Marinobacter fonticola TaxID=2603215 RepID=UPI0011E73C1D|nr:arginine N-succinyltransferase [Marinobacter fonticola]
MLLIRPINQGDLEDLHKMAEGAGKGLTSLPPNRDLLARKIARSEDTFGERCEPEAGMYLFALEDTAQGKCVGISGIEARVGLDEVWYNYRLSTTVNASRELGVHVRTPTLHLTNDMTDTSEICSLLLSKTHRQGGNGLLLSRCRFLFMADFRNLFSEKVFAEMRGYSDENGRSPLWDALGRRFFDMDFSEADFLSGMGNKSFIAELMPKYPIYLPLLPQSAREVVSQVHENTKPALRMLQAEGFNFNGLVDIFDAGPVVEAFIHNVRTVRESIKRHVLVTRQPVELDVPAEQRVMVSNRSFRDFRVTTLPMKCIKPDTVSMPAEVAEALQVSSGDMVRLSPLKDGANVRTAK